MNFNESDYPCVYLDSNGVSLKAQKVYKSTNWSILSIMLLCIIGVSISNDLVAGIKDFEKIIGFLFIITAIASSLMLIVKPEKNWYVGRAVAESVKTLTWRFIIRSEPFNTQDEKEDERKFIKRIREISDQALKDNFKPALNKSHTDLITQKMIEVRNMDYLNRKAFYATHRIKNQIDWYTSKSKINQNRAITFSIIIILCQLLTAVYLLFFIDLFTAINITEVLIFVATTLIAIMEMNKYKELHQSYLFTSIEINFIKNKFSSIEDDAELDKFVNEAEQAISREHTMWLARRGNSNYLKNKF